MGCEDSGAIRKECIREIEEEDGKDALGLLTEE